MTRLRRLAMIVAMCYFSSGCASSGSFDSAEQVKPLADRAFAYLRAAIQYDYNPAVRVSAVEALKSVGGDRALPWIRSALLDGHAAVRFAGCMAVGELRDSLSIGTLRERLTDEDQSVRVAAVYALYRLGFAEHVAKLSTFLLNAEKPMVRRHAAMALGRLSDINSIQLLARAMTDRDAGVRQQVLEALAMLGNAEAKQELVFMTNSGVGAEEVFAISALASTMDRRYIDTFRYKLETGTHLETRLAAAKGLGMLGFDDGYDIAVRALKTSRPRINDPSDSPAGQILRVRQLASLALGAIGRSDALAPLSKLLNRSNDPRVQVSVAMAILEIAQPTADTTPLFGKSLQVR